LATLHIYPSGGHGWFNKSNFNYRNQALEELKLWLQEVARKSETCQEQEPQKAVHARY